MMNLEKILKKMWISLLQVVLECLSADVNVQHDESKPGGFAVRRLTGPREGAVMLHFKFERWFSEPSF